MEKIFDTTAYVICHNGADVIHPSKVEAGTHLASGQPEYEEFDNEDAWKARLKELGYEDEKLAALDPAARLNALPGLAKLTPEERRALSPEERQAMREERKTARLAAKAATEA